MDICQRKFKDEYNIDVTTESIQNVITSGIAVKSSGISYPCEIVKKPSASVVSTLTGPSCTVSKNNVVNCSVTENEDILHTISDVLHNDGIDFPFNLHGDNSIVDDAEKMLRIISH